MPTLTTLRDQLLGYQPTFRILDHWIGRQQPGTMKPIDFDPVEVSAVLPYLYLLERIGDRLRYRLSGEEVNRLFGTSHAGRFLDEVVPPDVYPIVAPFFLRVFDPAICVFKGRVVLPGRDYLEFERVLMPIFRNGSLHLLGCLALSGVSPLRLDGVVVAQGRPGFDFTMFDLGTGAIEHRHVDKVPILRRSVV